MSTKVTSLTMLILLNPLIILCAQRQQIKFEHITVEQGLSENTVTCMLQDRQGFMWFGTLDGLNKYDGYSFTVYQHDPFDENSLFDSEVFSVYEDESGVLWIGTGKGFCSLSPGDREEGKFKRYGSLSILKMFEDNSGVLWGWSGCGLAKFNRNKQKFEHFRDYVDASSAPKDDRVFFDRNGALWWGMGTEGLFRLSDYDQENWELTNFVHDSNDPNSLPHEGVSATCEDSSGSLWFGTFGGRLSRLVSGESGAGIFVNYTPDEHEISTLLASRDGSLWIGTEGGGGLIKLIAGSKLSEANGVSEGRPTYVRYKHDPSDPNSLSNDNIMSICQDASGTYWVGTRGGGINKFDVATLSFNHYQHDPTDENSLVNDRVWSFYEDGEGVLWIGTSNGLSRLHRNTAGQPTFHNYYRNDIENPSGTDIHQIRAIHEDRFGAFWIGTLGRGLGRLDRQTGKLVYYRHDPDDPGSINSDNVYAIHEDRTGTLWIGTNGGGLNKFDRRKQRFTRFNQILRRNNTGQNFGWVTTIHEDREGFLWLGTWKEGLIRFDPETEEHTHYIDDAARPTNSSGNGVFAIHEDKRGILWLGTYGSGLCKMTRDYDDVTFRWYTKRDGLPNNVIYGILEDAYGNLWLSTNRGLSRFNPGTEEFRNYDLQDGLQSNEFNLGACYKSKTGEMFFGGVNGFNSFYPQDIMNPHPPQIVLIGFKKFGKQVRLAEPAFNTKKIRLSYNDRLFSFEFVALHYKEPSKNQYAYKMDGFDEHWIYVGAKREATYTNLDPGQYTFRVKAANCDGVWNEEGIAVQVSINPPFWGTYWFYLLCFLSVVLTAYSYHRYRLRQVSEIERARAETEERVRAKLRRDLHDEWGVIISIISLSCDALITNVGKSSRHVNDLLTKISENVQKLSFEMKASVWEIDRKRTTAYDLAVHLKNCSDRLFDETGMAFQLVGLSNELANVTLPIDWRHHLPRIFIEGMHNILKHAKSCKNITLEIKIADGYLTITLSDDGKGFDLESYTGGEGIKNMRDRTEKIGGKIQIISKVGEGVQIRFTGKLP